MEHYFPPQDIEMLGFQILSHFAEGGLSRRNPGLPPELDAAREICYDMCLVASTRKGRKIVPYV